VISALEARPKLRRDVKIVRREHRGRVRYVVKTLQERKYYEFGETEVGLIRLMDGSRTPAEICAAAAEALGVRPPPEQIADFAHKLKRLGIVERTRAEQHLMLMERLRAQRKVRAGRRTRGSILRLRFSIGDPDRLFARIVARVPWFWSASFVWASLALFATYLIIVFTRWDVLWQGTVGLATLSGFGAWDWVLLYGLSLVIIGIHEFGHGLTTKYLGGEVHEIGGMLLYFSPALYCNTNDAWTFEKRAHRLWVTFAGPWIQLVIAAVAALAWVLTEPTSFIHRLAFLGVLTGGILSVLANLNPLIPLDGYYALSDWLEIPNLRRRAFNYCGWLAKTYLLGMTVNPPPTTPRERRVFRIYGGLALAYSVFLIVISLLWLILVIGRFLGPWVWVIALLIAARLLARLSGRGRALALAASTTWRAGFLRGRRAAVLLAALVVGIGLPFMLPWTSRSRGELRIEATPRALVRAQVAGILDRWHVAEGDTVRAGDAVASLWNPALESAVLELQAQVERRELTRARAEASGDLAMAASAGSVLEELQQNLAVLRAQREQLVVRTPIEGIVLGHRLEESLGKAVDKGALLVQVAALEGRRARVRLPAGLAQVAPGQSASFKLFARPDLKFRSVVSAVAPAASAGWLEVEVPVSTTRWLPKPGMTGIVKIQTWRGTIAQAISRAVRRTFRLDLWL
jgi:multidrug efflux pump subunit AcrA (membrane-fusion protein)